MLALSWWNRPGLKEFDGIICDGAVRSGKTVCLVDGFFLWSMASFSGCIFALCGKTVSSLRRNVVIHLHSQMRCIRSTGGEGDRVQKVENATLIHSGNVQKITDRLLKLCTLQQTLEQDAVVEDQRVGQRVVMCTPWSENMHGYITAMHSTFTQGGHTAAVTVLGTLQLPEEENLFAGEFYSGIWEVI